MRRAKCRASRDQLLAACKLCSAKSADVQRIRATASIISLRFDLRPHSRTHETRNTTSTSSVFPSKIVASHGEKARRVRCEETRRRALLDATSSSLRVARQVGGAAGRYFGSICLTWYHSQLKMCIITVSIVNARFRGRRAHSLSDYVVVGKASSSYEAYEYEYEYASKTKKKMQDDVARRACEVRSRTRAPCSPSRAPLSPPPPRNFRPAAEACEAEMIT